MIAWGAVTLTMVGFQIILFALVLLLKRARRHEKGQKPEEVYVIEDKQLQNMGPVGNVVIENRYMDPRATRTVM
jgi:hypothetical protein